MGASAGRGCGGERLGSRVRRPRPQAARAARSASAPPAPAATPPPRCRARCVRGDAAGRRGRAGGERAPPHLSACAPVAASTHLRSPLTRHTPAPAPAPTTSGPLKPARAKVSVSAGGYVRGQRHASCSASLSRGRRDVHLRPPRPHAPARQGSARRAPRARGRGHTERSAAKGLWRRRSARRTSVKSPALRGLDRRLRHVVPQHLGRGVSD